ncbi:ATP-dependent DNA helicase Snf21 [Mycoemilia scoparia]|uniref:ATP-dependent DNA helicase Snf21 n=1 Tax=Mycoemilia scoparia TaxID=417184 RepID=A0A9W8A8T1_9FUNG|nr:ATP-dependent DNA helicase Snf21 [Mycoemilia scoparia]
MDSAKVEPSPARDPTSQTQPNSNALSPQSTGLGRSTTAAETIRKLVENIKILKEKGASPQELEPRVKLLYAILAQQKKLNNETDQQILSPSIQNGPPPSSSAEQSQSQVPNIAPDVSISPDQGAILNSQANAFRMLAKNIPLSQTQAQALVSTTIDEKEKAAYQKTVASFDTVGARAVEAIRNHLDDNTSTGSGQATDKESISMKKIEDKLPQLIPLISPYSLLKDRLKNPEQASRLHRLLVPSITPAGISPHVLARERESRRLARIRYRIQELESLPANLANEELDVNYPEDEETPWRPGLVNSNNASAKIKAIIELKALRLHQKQRRLREEMIAGMAKGSALATASDRAAFRRMKKQLLRDVRKTEQRERQQRADRERKEQKHHSQQLEAITKHGGDLITWHRSHQQRVSRLGKLAMQYHTHAEREEQKRLERISKERLNALRADDEEAYLKLIDQTKDTRIAHLLKQTNTYLESLISAVKQQKMDVDAPASQEDQEDKPAWASESQQEADNGKEDYYTSSHRIQEKINEQPTILVGGKLKDYQLRGLEWMVSLYNNRLNGILADEMGLGKTIQTISLVTYLIEKKQQNGPFLILVPLSTITNWSLEFEKWAPAVRTIVYKGKPPERRELQRHIRQGQFHVLLTTYDYIIRDRPVLSKVKWVHTIIDEGHRMKNAESKLTLTLTQHYNSRYRLILTGTPLQNNLPELWALLNFVLPKIFNSVKSFDEWFNAPFANTGGQDKIELNEEEQLLIIRRLHKVLRPFLLRRLKRDVEADLPDKVEHIVMCKMSPLQQKLYNQMRKHATLFNVQSDGGKGGARSSISGLSNTIMQLRKICNHPFVYSEVESVINPTHTNNELLFRVAGKFELLDRILPKLFATNHKVLMFFQMTQVMTIMEDFLTWRGWRSLRLDGSTSDDLRREQMHIFNSPDSPFQIFLLSTRAGGQGLNLQTADTVIIFDSDWNPHQDLQAQDRAHRIGQKNEVRILRLITQKSVEVSILERAQYKLDIDGKVIQAGKFDNNSTPEEREAYLRSLLKADDDDPEESLDNQDEENKDEYLNQLISRSDFEKELFEKMDKERVAREAELAKDFGGPGDSYERFITEAELPKEYLTEYDPEKERRLREEEELKINKRRQNRVYYDDGLTEEQFLNAVEDEEDLDEVVRKQRQRKERLVEKRRLKKIKKLKNGDSGQGDIGDSEIDSESDAQSTTRTPRKRVRIKKIGGDGGDDISTITGDQPRTPSIADSDQNSVNAGSSRRPNKRARLGGDESLAGSETPGDRKRGRKINDYLSPEDRAQLTKTMEASYQAVANLVDPEYDRKRCELFLQLPKKRDYPDYFIIIQRPIAMRQIKQKIKNCQYYSLEQFYADWKLMFDNARTYNQEGSFVYVDACKLQECLESELEKLTGKSFATPPSSHPPLGSISSLLTPANSNTETSQSPSNPALTTATTQQEPSQDDRATTKHPVQNNGNGLPTNEANGSL